MMRLYPPYLGAGVRVRHIAPVRDVDEAPMRATLHVSTTYAGGLAS